MPEQRFILDGHFRKEYARDGMTDDHWPNEAFVPDVIVKLPGNRSDGFLADRTPPLPAGPGHVQRENTAESIRPGSQLR
jgi:hypothetical protein